MMAGLLRINGIYVGVGKVRQYPKRLDPSFHQIRHETAGRSLNPKCYNENYFGHKVYRDQNEKLEMFEVTHAMTRNGYSGMIVASSTIPVKINLIICGEIILQ